MLRTYRMKRKSAWNSSPSPSPCLYPLPQSLWAAGYTEAPPLRPPSHAASWGDSSSPGSGGSNWGHCGSMAPLGLIAEHRVCCSCGHHTHHIARNHRRHQTPYPLRNYSGAVPCQRKWACCDHLPRALSCAPCTPNISS